MTASSRTMVAHAIRPSIRLVSRVLVVDDEPMIVSFVSRALSAEGFRVDGATDGARGLELARTGGYELVVLDLLLPSIDGVTVLQELMESRPSQRVLVLSALSTSRPKCAAWSSARRTTCRTPFARGARRADPRTPSAGGLGSRPAGASRAGGDA